MYALRAIDVIVYNAQQKLPHSLPFQHDARLFTDCNRSVVVMYVKLIPYNPHKAEEHVSP
jgi:hypothetical protein